MLILEEKNLVILCFLLLYYIKIKIKPLKLLVRKRFSTGSFKLGFGTTLNTGTTQLGFVGGASVTITDLIDEELIW